MSVWSLYVTVERLVRLPPGPQAVAGLRQARHRAPQAGPAAGGDRRRQQVPRQPPGPGRRAPACSRSSSRTQTSPLTEDEIVEAASRAIERATLLTTSDFKKGIGSLATIATTAPFIGLFGTVIGIINAFRGMALTGSGGIGAVSAGIAEALVTTALGLFVAIPAAWMFNFFTRPARALQRRDVELGLRADRLLHEEAEEKCCVRTRQARRRPSTSGATSTSPRWSTSASCC